MTVRNASAVKQFSHTLAGVQGGITLFKEGIDEFFLSHGYPNLYKELEFIRPGLEDLGLYETMVEAIKSSEALVRLGRFDDAEMVVLEANRSLSMASGAEADLRRLYKSANE